MAEGFVAALTAVSTGTVVIEDDLGLAAGNCEAADGAGFVSVVTGDTVAVVGGVVVAVLAVDVDAVVPGGVREGLAAVVGSTLTSAVAAVVLTINGHIHLCLTTVLQCPLVSS